MSTATVEKTSRIVETVIPYARKLFGKYGYKKTTVDDIASGLHISKKTLYSVFPSKEEILRETIWRETIEILHKFNDTIPSGTQSDTILLSLCRFIFTDRIKRGKTGYFWGLYVEDDDINQASIEALKRVFVTIYNDGFQKGLLKPIDSRFAVEVILSIVITSVKNFSLTTKPVRMYNDALNMIADAIAYKDRIAFNAMG